MVALFGRRWPVYAGGFLIGLSLTMLLLYAKRSFAPEFHDKKDERAAIAVAAGGRIVLRFEGKPEERLVHGFPSTLFLAKELDSGRWKPLLKLDYEELLSQEHVLGPWNEAGRYEIRMALYLCRVPGAKNCLRRLVVQPFTVGPGPESAGFSVDLNADLPEDQARPIP